jgi:hypothetical protein
MQKQLLIALIAVIVALTGAQQSAKADGVVTNEYSLSFADFPGDMCTAYGFQIMVDAVFNFKETSFFDKHGNLVKFRIKWTLAEGAYKNGSDPTKFIDLAPGWGANQWIDVETGQNVQTGASTKITVPGWGVILQQIGRIVVNPNGTTIFEAGQWGYPEDMTVVCDYLAM